MELAVVTPGTQGTTTQALSVGVRHQDQWGRVFYYAKAASAVGRGKVGIAAAVITSHNNMNFATAPAVGDRSVSVTLASAAATADQYKDGWLVVQDGTGEGRAYRVEGHGAQSTTTGNLTVYLAEAIDTAGAVSELNVDLIYNKYDELRPVPDTAEDYVVVGVPICVGGLGAGEFGYIQTWGPCSVWRDAAETLGRELTLGATTGTGQVQEKDHVDEVCLGTGGPAVGVETEYQLMYLKISQ